jgi:flagellar biosynthetic protein FliR
VTPEGFLVPWLLAACRVAGFLFPLPALGGPRVPMPASVGLGLFVAASSATHTPPVRDLVAFGALALKETAVGLLLGWGVALAFTAIHVGAQVAELNLGLGTGQLVDPVHGHESTALAQLWSTLALVVYLITDAHHHALRLVGTSFALLPPDRLPSAGSVAELGAELFVRSFLAGVQLAAPLVVASVAVEAGIALMARAAPQVNVFLVALPLKVGVALMLVGIFLPHTLAGVTAAWEQGMQLLAAWIRRGP